MSTQSPESRISPVSNPLLGVNDTAFDSLNAVLKKWFYKPDLQAIRIILGTMSAHYLRIGDPAWLFVVAPPGAGKTTMSLMGACGLPEVISLSDFSESTFLSGFYGHGTPGLLEKLGHTVQEGDTYTTQGNALFLAKDFTTVLSMRREKRGVILSQLREIHDGSFKRAFGTGQTKIWNGRVSIIAAVTPVLDRHYSIFTVLGERFMQLRWHRPDSEEAGEWAIKQQGQEETIQQQVREVITEIFKGAPTTSAVLSVEMSRRIAALSEVIALARTYVFRSSYGNREIEYVPEAEANTRLSKGLAAIARGISSLNRREMVEEVDLQDALRVGLDCIPQNRRTLMLAVLQGEDPSSINMPRTVRKRELEDLKALEILESGSPEKPTSRVARLFGEANVIA